MNAEASPGGTWARWLPAAVAAVAATGGAVLLATLWADADDDVPAPPAVEVSSPGGVPVSDQPGGTDPSLTSTTAATGPTAQPTVSAVSPSTPSSGPAPVVPPPVAPSTSEDDDNGGGGGGGGGGDDGDDSPDGDDDPDDEPDDDD